jgi:flagellar protein FlaG
MIDAVTNVQQVDVSTIKKGGSAPTLSPESSASKSSEISGRKVSTERVGENILSGINAGQSPGSSDKSGSTEEIKKFLDELNTKLHSLNKETRFQLDKKIDMTYVSVINKDTKEVIKEFPPEEIRAFMAKMREFNETTEASMDNLIVDMEV